MHHQLTALADSSRDNTQQYSVSPWTTLESSLMRSVIILILSTDVGLFGSSR